MAGSKPVVYWDACVFIAFLKGDKPAEAIKAGLKYWSEKARSGEVTLVTSTLTYVEVLRFHHQEKYWGFLEFVRRHVQKRAADHIVCQRAHIYRDHFAALAQKEHEADVARAETEAREASKRKGKPVKPQPVKAIRQLATPDSIHLATAAVSGCNNFHTFDGTGKDEGRFRKLIHLNGQIPQFGIPISLPLLPASEEMDFFDAMR